MNKRYIIGGVALLAFVVLMLLLGRPQILLIVPIVLYGVYRHQRSVRRATERMREAVANRQ